MKAIRIVGVGVLGLQLATASSALATPADIVTRAAVDQGFYYGGTSPFHDPANGNYLARVAASGDPTHDFFVFDVSGLGAARSASLRLYNPGLANDDEGNGYGGPRAAELFTLHGYAGSIPVLVAGGNSNLYAPLVAGPVWGGQSVSAADNGSFVDVPLNAAFLAAVRATNGMIALGGEVSGGYVFGFTSGGSGDVQLVVTLPEPTTLSALTVVAAGAIRSRRRRR